MLWDSKYFQPSDIPDLTGKIAIVTGSSSGLGKVSATELARKNCTVIVAANNMKESLETVEEIKAKTGNDKVEYIELDLGSFKSVDVFVETFTKKYDAIHILMCNAGYIPDRFIETSDGLETQFQVNYLSHYYLTQLLLPLIEKSAPSRVVFLSSLAHQFATFTGIDYATLQDKDRRYFSVLEYGKTKAQNLMFTRELSKRLKAKGVENVYVNSAHPGGVVTQAAVDAVGSTITNTFFITPEQGALTQLYLATSPEVEEKKITGQYCTPTPKCTTPSAFCRSEKNAAELWEYSEKVLKEKAINYQGATV